MQTLPKSSKQKQRLYEKFLKNQNEKNEPECKTYKKLFESIKKCSKKLHFSNLLFKYKHNIKKTWEVTDEDLIVKQFNMFLKRLELKLLKRFKHLHYTLQVL